MKTKIIAEVGYNHNGFIEKAKAIIDEARKLKLWAVKFQKWDIESFPENIKKQLRKGGNSYGENYYSHRKHLEFSIDQLIELKQYAEKKGLAFVCSGKDYKSVVDLVDAGIKYIKIPSQRYHDNRIFRYLYEARKNKDIVIIVSTGMMDSKQIKKSRWKDKDGADIIMHCVSLYPAELKDCNMQWMKKLRYNGYSSHETEGKAIKYAVAMGAEYIERHYTLDKFDKGSDHCISSDYEEMQRILTEIEETEKIMGDGQRKITEKEIKLGEYYRSF